MLSYVLSYCDVTSVSRLGSINAEVALQVLQCLLHMQVKQWRLVFPLYTRARYATHPATHSILSTVWFSSFLSRACRVCGKQTQRRIFGASLCAACTRNCYHKCWMIPESVAVDMFQVHVPAHKGPRCSLVFAQHVQQAVSFKMFPFTLSRNTLIYHVNTARPSRQ